MTDPVELFASTAPYYARYRHPYQPAVYPVLAGRLGLGGDSVVLDGGTGTGAVALGLAPFAGRVVAVDPSADMLEESRRQAAADARAVHSGRSPQPPWLAAIIDLTARYGHDPDHGGGGGRQLSYSYTSPARLGQRREAYVRDLHAALLAFEPDGVFPLGEVVTELVVAVRP